MAPVSVKLGPGVLSFGPAGTPVEASCQLQNGVISWDKDKDDDITPLCGDVIAGATRYTATFSGTMIQDLTDDGIVAWSWTNKGTPQTFTYTPNSAAAASFTGTLVPDPLDVGSTDDFGSIMTSDFEWDIVGEPTPTWSTGAAATEAETPVDLDAA